MADNEVRSSAPSVVMHGEAEVSGTCFTRTTHFGCRFVTSLRIEESFDTSLGGFGKGVVLEFKLGHLRIGRKPSIQLLEIATHHLLQSIGTDLVVRHLIPIGDNEGYQRILPLHDQ